MTTNSRDCVIVPFELALYETQVRVDTELCDGCTEGDSHVMIPMNMIDQGESTKKVSLAGLHMMHIVANDSVASCVKVSVRRIIKCRNCAVGCGTDVFYLDMGCLSSGQVFATGDYEITIEQQINMADYDFSETGISLSLVFEPIIDEHIQSALFNKC